MPQIRTSRIGYLVSQYPAASHTFIRREINALRHRGVQISAFSVRQPPNSLLQAEADLSSFQETSYLLPIRPVELIRAHVRRLMSGPLQYFRCVKLAVSHRVPGLRSLLWSFFHFLEAGVLAERLVAGRISHIHCHFANSASTVGLIASRLSNIDYSFALHGTADIDYPAGPLLGRKIKEAKFVACASYHMRAQAMCIVNEGQWEKLELVRCLVDVDTLPRRTRPSHAPFQLISVGRLSSEKGFIGLLRAFASVCAINREITLTIVGDGPDSDKLRREISRLGIESRVVFKGRLSERDTLQAIAEADALVLASFSEGLPVVLMEAMALGVPVIASHIAGIPELVIHGETGLLFTPTDWEGLAGNLSRLAQSPELRVQLATAGRAFFLSNFDRDKSMDVLVREFAGLAAAP